MGLSALMTDAAIFASMLELHVECEVASIIETMRSSHINALKLSFHHSFVELLD